MSINLDVIIDSEDNEVDMKSTLDTMQGVSNSVRTVAEAVYEENFSEHLTHASPVRTTLMKSFKGSYGHTFKIDFFDESSRRHFRKYGKNTFVELYQYFISEALLTELPSLSSKAQKVLDGLGEKSDLVVEKIRKSHLKDIHQSTKKCGYDVCSGIVNLATC